MRNCTIKWRGRLTSYRDDIDAHVYRYRDNSQEFYFDTNVVNEIKSPDEKWNYDVAVFNLGKINWREQRYISVSDLPSVRRNIEEFFLECGIHLADTSARQVIFK